MPVDPRVFAQKSPYLYHLTASANLPAIRRTRTIESAALLAKRGERADLLCVRRPSHVTLQIDGETAVLRDQAPLHAGNMRLEGGWTFAQFVESLNSRVFFWPGTERGPIDYGQRHYARYASERPAILRVAFSSLTTHNAASVPLFCKYNSGSPRWSNGTAPVRGAETFQSAENAQFSAGQVIEVTFLDRIHLPMDVEQSEHPDGPWALL